MKRLGTISSLIRVARALVPAISDKAVTGATQKHLGDQGATAQP